MPNKGSRAIGVRIPNGTIERIMERAASRGWTFNRWMNWAVAQGLRPHRRTDKTRYDDQGSPSEASQV